MLKKARCINYKPGYIPCELCIINKEYIDLQNAKCVSCFKADPTFIE